MRSKQAAAIVALVAALVSLGLLIYEVVRDFPPGLETLALIVVGVLAAWFGALRRGAPRVIGLVIAVAALAAGFYLLFTRGHPLVDVAIVAIALVALAAGRTALHVHAKLPSAPRPKNPVLFMNPRSGGGKSVKFRLADEARARGIEAVELEAGDDLETLVRDAVTNGADGLAMAGGDGSQAIVAKIAAELRLPYACIPAGTRNHLALDLGVDRNDVVGALDAFVDGGERIVDLAEVNGRVFVNNVALGLYAEAVQREEYRDAKLRTILDTVPDTLGSGDRSVALRWKAPDGERHEGGAAMLLVSNNVYRLGAAVGNGTRPRLDQGLLGIASLDAPSGLVPRPKLIEWSQAEFTVDADEPVPAGVDGEAVMLDPPLRFTMRPQVLTVRIAPHHPGASPSAALTGGPFATTAALLKIAVGQHPGFA